MPVSLQHYDYSELLELLAHYRKSMKHFEIGAKVVEFTSTDKLVLNELQIGTCPHKLKQEAFDQLNTMNV